MNEDNVIPFPVKAKEKTEKDPTFEAARELNALFLKVIDDKTFDRLQHKFPPPKRDIEDVTTGQLFTANFKKLLDKCNPNRKEQLSSEVLSSLIEELKLSLGEADMMLS